MFLVKQEDDSVAIYYNNQSLNEAGIEQADLEITEQEWFEKGGFARVLNGEIFVGDTDEEKAASELTTKLAFIDRELDELEKKQERSNSEITAAVIQEQAIPEESKRFHLLRQERIEELRQERKLFAS